jgi:dTDP-4-dehydrorhamnose 3,5-epimerase
LADNKKFKILNDTAEIYKDKRGSLKVLYESKGVILKKSFSYKGVMRGLHYQVNSYKQKKIIRVVSGEIIDFLADPYDKSEVVWMRKIGKDDGWIEISDQLAHGFYAVTDVEFEYICIGEYSEGQEKTFSIMGLLKSSNLNIDPKLSEKDQKGKSYGKILKEVVDLA